VAAAIVDIGLGDGDGRALCDELSSRNIPFAVYSGYTRPLDLDVHFIEKPAPMTALVEAIEKLLGRQATSTPLPSDSDMHAT
jgi:hypothetical protein